ncbi:MAG: sarcosine oxidase subunit gamma [Marinibacterium sp.]|nr:sarcosine oxidase subunit gamma [Marinibacterium sp.]
MSNAVTAVNGARFDGLVEVSDAGLQGMITLRGDLADIGQIVTDTTGTPMPDMLQITRAGSVSIGWMSPDELLVLCPYGDTDALVAKLVEALDGKHALVVDVSEARAMFRLSGGPAHAVREVLAKLTPADMSPDACPAGLLRRTRLAQIPAAVWFDADGAASVICFRSVGQYGFDLLKTAAAPGSGVGYF